MTHLFGPNGAIPSWMFDLSPGVLMHLFDAAMRSLTIASLAGAAIGVAHVRNLSLKLSIWRSVVCAALTMPILAVCLPPLHVSVAVPQLIQNVFPVKAMPRQADVNLPGDLRATASNPAFERILRRGTQPEPLSTPMRSSGDFSNHSRRIPWSAFALAAYALGTLFLSARFIIGWVFSRKLRHSSRPILDLGAASQYRSCCLAMQLQTTADLAESDLLAVPLTCGVLHPAVLLPANWRTWDADKLKAVLSHEVSHVARRDALTERLALLHRIVFWFSPLAWWLPRCLAELAEEASDEAALAFGVEPTKYAETLLEFLGELNSTSFRADWQGVAMAQRGRADKRIDRILSERSMMAMQSKKYVVAGIILASVPVVLVAASLQPQRLGREIVLESYQSRAVAPIEPAAPIPQSSASPPAQTVTAVVLPPTRPPVPAAQAPVVEAAPAVWAIINTAPAQATAAPAPPEIPAGYSHSFSMDDGDAYAIVTGQNQTMSGSFGHRNVRQLEALRSKMKTDFIWFERDGKSYVIIDPETVKRATQAFAAQSELGRRQGELGDRQGSLGALQGVLGEEQGKLGEQMGQLSVSMQDIKVEIPDVTAEMQALKLRTQELTQAISQKDLAEMQTNMAQMNKEIAEATKQMSEAQIQIEASHAVDSAKIEAAMEQARGAMDAQISQLTAEQMKLGEQQEKLGAEQEKLGQQQEEVAAKAQAEIKAIITEALKCGLAKPAPKQ